MYQCLKFRSRTYSLSFSHHQTRCKLSAFLVVDEKCSTGIEIVILYEPLTVTYFTFCHTYSRRICRKTSLFSRIPTPSTWRDEHVHSRHELTCFNEWGWIGWSNLWRLITADLQLRASCLCLCHFIRFSIIILCLKAYWRRYNHTSIGIANGEMSMFVCYEIPRPRAPRGVYLSSHRVRLVMVRQKSSKYLYGLC